MFFCYNVLMDKSIEEKPEEKTVTKEPVDKTEEVSTAELEKTEEEEIEEIKRSINMKTVRISVCLALILALIFGIVYLFWMDNQGLGTSGIYRLVATGAFAPLLIILAFHFIHLILSKSNLKEELRLIKKYPYKKKKYFTFSLEGLKQFYASKTEYEPENSEEFNYVKAMYYEEELGVNSSRMVGTFVMLVILTGLAVFFMTGHVIIFGIPLIILAAFFGIVFISLFVTRIYLSKAMMDYVHKIKEL